MSGTSAMDTITSESKSRNPHCQWCSAVNCNNNRNSRPDLSFHRFPKSGDLSKRWVINSRRADLEGKSVSALNLGNVLCSEHFEPSLLIKTKTKTILKRQAVPTLFDIPNPPPKLTPARAPPKHRCVQSTSKESAVQEVLADSPTNSLDDNVTSLKRKLNSERCKNYRFKKRIKLSSSKKINQREIEQKEIEQSLAKLLPERALKFVLTQLRVSQMSSKGRRWTSQEKSLALSLYHTSKKAYSLLQRIFNLPSPSTLLRAMRNLHLKPGFCENVLSLFQIKVNVMPQSDKICAVIFDEICLKSSLKYDPLNDIVEGFEDFGHLGRSQNVATSALVFMVRGIFSKWKQPLAYVLSKGPVKAEYLKILLMETIGIITDQGLIPKVIVCDQGSNNRSLFKQLSITPERPYFLTPTEQKIFAFYDPPHLIKSVRNNLKLHGYSVESKDILWSHVVDFFALDCTSPIRLAPRLKKRHIKLPNFAKQKVNLAVQVMSHSVAAGISTMVRFSALPHAAMDTAKFLEHFDQLFNCFNSRCTKSQRVMGNAFSSTPRQVEFLHKTQDWLRNLKAKNKSGILPCLSGWVLNINSLQMLLTDRLNQDCLENLFSVIRGKGGHRHNPDSLEFRMALRQILTDAIIVPSKRQNCQEDADRFLFSLDNVPSLGADSSIKSRVEVDVPKILQPLMVAEPSVFTMVEENILTYIAGYLVNKLTPFLCSSCATFLEGSVDQENPRHVFLSAKQFQECRDGGLKTPSDGLFQMCHELENVFRTYVPKALHSGSIRSSTIRHIICKLQKHPATVGLVCPIQKCEVVYSTVSLFVNIRLHHLIKCKNEELAETNSKKVSRKLDTLRHV